MIRNQWYVILESNEVKRGKPVGVTRLGEKMVVWRDAQGKVTCMVDWCPHRGVALSHGTVNGDRIECPFHGFQYDASGACALIPANGKHASPPKAMRARTYITREAHDLIYIWWGEPRANLPPLPFFPSITDAAFSYATIRDRWATHYSRAIENQLDVAHLPFVHRTTIGRGNLTLVNGPRTRLSRIDGNEFLELWFSNDVDRGQTPLRAGEIPEPRDHPLLQFIFPNLWQNWLGDNMRIMIAFVPIDDANTMMYIRQYQRIVTVPVLRGAFNLIGRVGNFIIERQDRRVVLTQTPKRPDLRIGETLIPADGPIIQYRRRRQELIAAAQ